MRSMQPTLICKTYDGYIHKNGYGMAWNPRTKKTDVAHRVAYEREVGPIPPGHSIDHLCSNKACIETTHLEAVPHHVNCWRGPGTKMTVQQVLEIRSSTEPSRKLAPHYGVHDSTIRQARRGHHFRNLLEGIG